MRTPSRPRRPLLLAFALLPLLAGCALDPVDTKPPEFAPQKWASGSGDPKADMPDDWWEAFADPALDKVVALALENSPGIDSAYARVRAARAAAGLADSGFWPTFGLSGNYANTHYTQSQLSGAVAGHTTDNYNLGGGFGYEVDLWGRVRNKAGAADAEYRSSHADLAGARLLVTGEVVKLWFDLRQAKVERAIVSGEFEARERRLALLAERRDAGILKADDVARAELLVSQSREELETLELKVAHLRNALAAAVGVSGLPEPPDTIPETLPEMPVSVPSAMIRNRPDLAAADMRLDAALLREGAARANFYPNVTLAATGGFSSINAGDLFSRGSAVWSLGPTVSLPILTGGKNDSELELARARFDAAGAAYRRAVLVAFRETEDALVSVSRLQTQERFAGAAVRDAERICSYAAERSASGVSSELDVVTAAHDALAARRSLAKVRFDRLRAAAGLALTLGGGWRRDTDLAKSADAFERRQEGADHPPAAPSGRS